MSAPAPRLPDEPPLAARGQPATGDRLVIALVLGLWGGLLAWFAMHAAPDQVAKDFSWPYRAARALVAGQDPYDVIRATGAYPFNTPLLYPLPAAILIIPFAPLPPAAAGALFMFVSSALLAWALTREGYARLPLFLGAPFCMAAVLGQWSPLLVASALLPAFAFTGAAKPNIGLVAFAWRPTWRGVVGVAALGMVSVAIQPRWIVEWLVAVAASPRYRGPLFHWTGLVLLLGALRWRRREGRLFLAMSCVPQLSLFYDQLPLALIPHSFLRSVVLAALSWVAWYAWYPYRGLAASVAAARPWVLGLLYLPALAMLLLLPRAESPGHAPDRAPRGRGATGA